MRQFVVILSQWIKFLSRPYWDGIVIIGEANNWYQNGNGGFYSLMHQN